MKPDKLDVPFRTLLADLLDKDFAGIPTSQGSEADEVPGALWEQALLGPARLFLSSPGKNVRARLVDIAWLLGGGPPGGCPPALAHVVEILHAGSLIIDDIEDGSTERRGAPALHVTVGVPQALNTGNWLYFWPFALLSRLEAPPATHLALFRETSYALLRCHQGQALDLAVRVHQLAQRDLPAVVTTTTRLKTGSLLELAALLPALVAGAPAERTRALGELGRDLGTALQMLDDLSGLLREDRRDKGHEDLAEGRPTWPWAWLADDLDELSFAKAQHQSLDVTRGADPGPLREFLADRLAQTGRVRVRAHLDRLVASLTEGLAGATHLDAAIDEIRSLEGLYV